MQTKNKHVMDFLLSRRSDSARTLMEPGPNKSTLQNILIAAARTPDHGKLIPWRFLVLKHDIMPSVAAKILEFGRRKQLDPDKLQKSANTFLMAPLIVAVVSSPISNEKVPLIEQQLSAGAVCLALLNAAQAEGWGANWLTGWMSYDKPFLKKVFGFSDNEFVAGFIHIGTRTKRPVPRERPEIDKITSWLKI